MQDLRNLYEQVILEHNRNPRNYGKPDGADKVVEGFNPLCGDSFTVYVNFTGEAIDALHFDGNGCALSKAAASLMTLVATGKSRREALDLTKTFEDMLKSDSDSPVDADKLGELTAFAGVRDFPMRAKCVMVAWRALAEALVQ